MLANVIDQILDLNGAVAYATVLFYIVNEGISIMENLADVGVPAPPGLKDRLKNIDNSNQSIGHEIKEEFSDKE
ncbi:toxin secretion/phage lysis holin [Gracilibacillus alcaliphilus]|nr:toxin secretion/phage lysis holin [Gracilibacillus alcaliphilus]